MTLKKATFPFPARYAFKVWLARARSPMDMEHIKRGMELYDQLSLDFVQEWIDDNSDGMGNVRFADVLKAIKDDDPIKPITVRLEQGSLTWLRDELAKHDWSLLTLQDGRSITIGVSDLLQRCIYMLIVAIDEAISAKEE